MSESMLERLYAVEKRLDRLYSLVVGPEDKAKEESTNAVKNDSKINRVYCIRSYKISDPSISIVLVNSDSVLNPINVHWALAGHSDTITFLTKDGAENFLRDYLFLTENAWTNEYYTLPQVEIF